MLVSKNKIADAIGTVTEQMKADVARMREKGQGWPSNMRPAVIVQQETASKYFVGWRFEPKRFQVGHKGAFGSQPYEIRAALA